MDSTWNIGSIGIAGPPLRGPSSGRLLAEPPLSPPLSSGPAPTASAQPLEPSAPPPVSLTAGQAPESTLSLGEPSVVTPKPASSLESLLMRFRLITPEQLDEALREKAETGKDVGAIVVERGWVNEDQLSRLVSYAPAFAGSAASAPLTSPDPPVEPATEDEEPSTEAFAEPPAERPLETPYLPLALEAPAAPAALEPLAPELPAEPAPTDHEIPPALELVEPEHADEHEPVAEVAEPVEAVVAEPVPDAESTSEPQPMFGPEPEPAPFAAAAVEHEPVEQPGPEPVTTGHAETWGPAEAAEPESHADPKPEDTALAQPEPQPDPDPEPAHVEPEPVARVEASVAAPEAQVVRFVEPAPIETVARVFVRMSNGERVEAGSFDDIASAQARAAEVVGQVEKGDGWPFFAGRYIRPEAIVSVDVDATVVRYA